MERYYPLRSKDQTVTVPVEDLEEMREAWHRDQSIKKGQCVVISRGIYEHAKLAVKTLDGDAATQDKQDKLDGLKRRLAISDTYIRSLEKEREELLLEKTRLHTMARIDSQHINYLLPASRNFTRLWRIFSTVHICQDCLERGKREMVEAGLDTKLEPVEGVNYNPPIAGMSGKPLC